MLRKRSVFIIIFSLLGGFLGTAVWAEQSKTFGDYVVHYNAFNTELLQPEIARRYGIKRSKNRVMYNITILKKVLQTTGQPVTAKVTGHASNLNDQFKQLHPRKIVEGSAIYYIGDLRVTNKETLDFEFQITPEGEKKPFHLKFRQQFFTK